MDDAIVSALQHHHRNQVQTMASLVGLFGRRMPEGEARKAFEDLRARYEALTFVPHAVDAEERVALDLADLARRVATTLDEAGAHRVEVSGEPLLVNAVRGSALAQLLSEMIIDLRRHGFSDGVRCHGEVATEVQPDGAIRIVARRLGQGEATPPTPAGDLGRMLADAVAASLGGAVTRQAVGGFSCEALIPPQNPAR